MLKTWDSPTFFLHYDDLDAWEASHNKTTLSCTWPHAHALLKAIKTHSTIFHLYPLVSSHRRCLNNMTSLVRPSSRLLHPLPSAFRVAGVCWSQTSCYGGQGRVTPCRVESSQDHIESTEKQKCCMSIQTHNSGIPSWHPLWGRLIFVLFFSVSIITLPKTEQKDFHNVFETHS